MDATDFIPVASAEATCVAAVTDGDDGDEAAPAPPQRSQCEVCAEQPSKYTCPGCARRTCSLPCSKRHKEESGCTGKRDRLKYVSLQDFDDRQLMSGESPLAHPLSSVASVSAAGPEGPCSAAISPCAASCMHATSKCVSYK